MSDLPLVLIVDDNDRNRKLARDLLGHAGFRTLEAATAAAAIALAIDHQPVVVLMDLRLPDAGGTDAVRRLAADPRTSRIPVVAMTAMRIDERDDWLLDAGFVGYIAKPIDAGELPDLVRRFSALTRD